MSAKPLDVTVRPELPSDVPSVRAVEEGAFGRAHEADIVDAVRASGDWLDDGSLVAVDNAGSVVGHVLLSRGRLVHPDATETDIGMIGPVAVLPELQRRGVGGELMRAAISAAVARRYPVICLVGHPSYYPRFGFEPARPLGLDPPDPSWPDDAWMALRLPRWSPELRGSAYFAQAFGEG